MTGAKINLGELDIPARLSPALPRWATELLCAFACVMLAGLLRFVINLVIPFGAPFVSIYPATLLATLLAGWRSGALCLGLLLVSIWWLIIPPVGAFQALTREDAIALALNGLSCLVMILVAQGFRAASHAASAERNAKLEERDLLLRELDHRMKNNFQLVAALLDLQRRRAAQPETAEALADAMRRVQSMGQVHAFLYSAGREVERLDLAAYLHALCEALSDSLLLKGMVRLECHLEPTPVGRDRAVAVGMVVNELVTNAAKYAFPDGRSGLIQVKLTRTDRGSELEICDNGVGLSGQQGSGLGGRLVESFARQARATLTRADGSGVSYKLTLPD